MKVSEQLKEKGLQILKIESIKLNESDITNWFDDEQKKEMINIFNGRENDNKR